MDKKKYAVLTEALNETPELLYQVMGMKDAPKQKRAMMFEMMATAMEQQGLPKPLVEALRLLRDDKVFQKVLVDFE